MSAAVININSVGRTSVTVHGHTYKLSPVERRLLTKLGGAPWTIDRATPEVIAEAYDTWSNVRSTTGEITLGQRPGCRSGWANHIGRHGVLVVAVRPSVCARDDVFTHLGAVAADAGQLVRAVAMSEHDVPHPCTA